MEASLSAAAALPAAFGAPDRAAAWLSLTVLMALRVAATFVMTPVFQTVSLPPSVRVLLVAALACMLAAGSPAPNPVWMGWPRFMTAAAAELALGATLGLGILLVFGTFSVAGQILSVQMGFGMAQIVDPVTQRPAPVLTSAFERLGVLVFFLINGHHALLRGLRYSVEQFPLGTPWVLAASAQPLFRQVAGLFSLGFALAAPVAFCILLVEFVLGVIGRNLPQMNMFTMGIPVKILVGLVALSLWFPGLGGTMSRVYASITSTWTGVFLAAGQVR